MSVASSSTSEAPSTKEKDPKKINQILESLVESNSNPKLVVTDLSNGVENLNINATSKEITNRTYPQQQQNEPINRAMHRSKSSDQDEYMDNVLNAKDRRTSWQQVRSQKSYVPSLTAICK